MFSASHNDVYSVNQTCAGCGKSPIKLYDKIVFDILLAECNFVNCQISITNKSEQSKLNPKRIQLTNMTILVMNIKSISVSIFSFTKLVEFYLNHELSHCNSDISINKLSILSTHDINVLIHFYIISLTIKLLNNRKLFWNFHCHS